MALPDSYALKPNAVPAYFDAILDAGPPERFSVKFLENLGFTSTNDRLFIGILKDLGFLNRDGAPQPRYFEFLDRSRSKQILAEGIREAYGDLFAINTRANDLGAEEVKNKLRTLYKGKKTDLVIGNNAGSGCVRCNLQEPPGAPRMRDVDLYSFVYRGVLTEEALDLTGRRRRSHFGSEDAQELQRSLSFDFLDAECLVEGQRMSVVYAAVHAFENAVRAMVTKAMAEKHGATWWDKVPERIQKTSKSRMEEDAKFRWHGARGASQINYCDFGDLSSIIVTNWEVFEDLLGNMEWAKATLNSLEKSRNIVMHGGSVAKEDVERIGMNIRDWIRQAG